MNTTILDQIIEPFAECLTPEAARKIVAIRADDELLGRVDELAKKANAGTLTDIEQSEYDRYLAVPCTVALQCYFFGTTNRTNHTNFNPFFLIRSIRVIRGQTTKATTGLKD